MKLRRLKSADDWRDGSNAPWAASTHDLSSHPDKDYNHVIRRPQLGRRHCCSRCCRLFCCCCCCCWSSKATEWSPRDRWEGWSEFFKAPLLLQKGDPEYDRTRRSWRRPGGHGETVGGGDADDSGELRDRTDSIDREEASTSARTSRLNRTSSAQSLDGCVASHQLIK